MKFILTLLVSLGFAQIIGRTFTGGQTTCIEKIFEDEKNVLSCKGSRVLEGEHEEFQFKDLTELAIGHNHLCYRQGRHIGCWYTNKVNLSPPPDLSLQGVSGKELLGMVATAYGMCAIYTPKLNLICWGDLERTEPGFDLQREYIACLKRYEGKVENIPSECKNENESTDRPHPTESDDNIRASQEALPASVRD